MDTHQYFNIEKKYHRNFQKSKNGDPLSLLKKQLEDKERTLQKGKKFLIRYAFYLWNGIS